MEIYTDNLIIGLYEGDSLQASIAYEKLLQLGIDAWCIYDSIKYIDK